MCVVCVCKRVFEQEDGGRGVYLCLSAGGWVGVRVWVCLCEGVWACGRISWLFNPLSMCFFWFFC